MGSLQNILEQTLYEISGQMPVNLRGFSHVSLDKFCLKRFPRNQINTSNGAPRPSAVGPVILACVIESLWRPISTSYASQILVSHRAHARVTVHISAARIDDSSCRKSGRLSQADEILSIAHITLQGRAICARFHRCRSPCNKFSSRLLILE